MEKITLFAFNGEAACFAHVLMNALDMKEKGYETCVVIEGTATRQIVELADSSKPFANLYAKAKEEGLIDAVCKACASMNKALDGALEQGLTLADEMSGHPSIARYMEEGFEILIF